MTHCIPRLVEWPSTHSQHSKQASLLSPTPRSGLGRCEAGVRQSASEGLVVSWPRCGEGSGETVEGVRATHSKARRRGVPSCGGLPGRGVPGQSCRGGCGRGAARAGSRAQAVSRVLERRGRAGDSEGSGRPQPFQDPF